MKYNQLLLTFLDFLITSISIAQSAFGILPKLIVDLWPSLALIAAFLAFILYNGGVVLGKKTTKVWKAVLTLSR